MEKSLEIKYELEETMFTFHRRTDWKLGQKIVDEDLINNWISNGMGSTKDGKNLLQKYIYNEKNCIWEYTYIYIIAGEVL